MDEPHTLQGASRLYGAPVSQRLVSGDVVLELHDESRFFVMSFVAPGRATEDDARALAPALTAWMDAVEGRIHGLIDCTAIRGTDAGWRSVLFEALSPRKGRLRFAWFGMNSMILILAKMFITALSATSAFDGKVFKEHDEALRWLERDVD